MKNNLYYQKLLAAAKKIGIPTKKILDMIYFLVDGSIKNEDLVRKVGIGKNPLNQIKKELAMYLQPASKLTNLKNDFKNEFKKIFSKDYQPEESFFSLLKTSESYQKVHHFINSITKYRPPPLRDFDQFQATEETVALRVALMDFFADIEGKRILFLGDDDFTSLTAAFFKKDKEIVVLEIDERIIDQINFLNKKLNLQVKIIKDDLKNPLLKIYQNYFDVVFTDPPYTLSGVKLFLSRAIEALDKKTLNSRIYICYGNSDRAKERFLPVNNLFYQAGLMTRWIFDKFNRYYNTNSIGASSLYILENTPRSKSLIFGYYEKPIYTID